MDNETIILEIWKKSRDTVEHLDRILSDFRKIICAIDGAFLAVAGSILISTCEKKILYIGILGLGLNLINFLIWTLEKHYHHYLMASAKVAALIEKQFKIDENIKLTHRLSEVKKLESPSFTFFSKFSIHYYDLMYIIPMSLGMLISFFSQSLWIYIPSFVILFIEFIKIKDKLKKQRKAENINE